MRCSEIILAVLQDPTRIDQLYTSVHRALIDARRLLKKSEKRADLFRKCLENYAKGGAEHITGPAHGIITACEKIGVTIECTSEEVIIRTPLGAKMNLNTPFDTHFQACIREACRYTIIKGLITRNTQGKEPQRKDMVGIEPHIDLSATMALLNSKSDKTDEEGNQCKLSRPQRLPREKRRHLQTIMAGSIRAPHRLKHAGKVSSDICTHPKCGGARCDTEHLFWKCAKHEETRRPYSEQNRCETAMAKET